jgi:hypothetical protein
MIDAPALPKWPVHREWGIELAEVFPGDFADQAGMQRGDILLKLDRMAENRERRSAQIGAWACVSRDEVPGW